MALFLISGIASQRRRRLVLLILLNMALLKCGESTFFLYKKSSVDLMRITINHALYLPEMNGWMDEIDAFNVSP